MYDTDPLPSSRRIRRLEKLRILPLGVLSLSFAALLTVATPTHAVEFLRGDANGDGHVSISDAVFIFSHLFLAGDPPECHASGDTDGSGAINISDAVHILSFIGGTGDAPVGPFPEPGDDPDTELACDSYGGGAIIDDASAFIRVADASADGGDSAQIALTIELRSAHPIAAYSLRLHDVDGVWGDAEPVAIDRSGAAVNPSWFLIRREGDEIHLSFDASFLDPSSIPPGEPMAVADIGLCLEPGTPAGDYEIDVTEAELSTGCVGNDCGGAGRAIVPTLEGGTLRVAATVSADATCDLPTEPEDPEDPKDPEDPEDPEDPPPHVNPEDLEATVTAVGGSASPGKPISVPCVIRSNFPVQGFSFSIDFDEEVLEGIEVREHFVDPNRRPFWVWRINNENTTPGGAGVDEGFVIAAGVVDLVSSTALPPEQDNQAITIDFLVRPETTAESTEIAFTNGARVEGEGADVENILTVNGIAVHPEVARSLVFIQAVFNIVPDVSVFVRGDSNDDAIIDVSDAVFTLAYLFQSGDIPRCLDAADVDDDGRLNVTDSVATLQFLFQGTRPPAPPFPDPGHDPTPDELSCF